MPAINLKIINSSPEILNARKYLGRFAFYIMMVCLVFSWQRDAGAQIKLKTAVPDLCYGCHKELKKGLTAPHVHFLFKEGKCITCHNSHVSTVKGLMNSDVNSICLECHEQIRNLLKNTNVHSPVKDNACIKCHLPHSGENRYLLVKGEKNLCLDCHETIKGQMDRKYACSPFRKGECSSCHNSHASSEGNLLLSAPNRLCQKCHSPRCRAGDVSIVSEVEKSECTSCHSGHSSQEKGILGPYGHKAFLNKNCMECHNPIIAGKKTTTKKQGDELCLSCHKSEDPKFKYVSSDIHVKGVKSSCTLCHDHHASGKKNLTKNEMKICLGCHEKTEKETAAMERSLKSIKCAPIKNRRCFECHIPVHSDQPLNYRTDEIGICAGCHESQHKITHPLGANVIDPRNGKSLTCISCHSMHNARADFMLTNDRSRALCIQCHKY